MLNDLLAIERGMAAHRIDLADRHPDVKDMAKGPAVRVRLSSNGAISGVELVPDAGRGILWTLRNGQQNGFPGLKTATALLSLDAQAREAHQQAWEVRQDSSRPPQRASSPRGHRSSRCQATVGLAESRPSETNR